MSARGAPCAQKQDDFCGQRLFLGSAAAANDKTLLRALGVRVLVNCTGNYPDPAVSAGVTLHRLTANRWCSNLGRPEDTAQDLAPVARAAASAATLCWCVEGAHRSALVVGALLLAATRSTPSEVFEHLRASHKQQPKGMYFNRLSIL